MLRQCLTGGLPAQAVAACTDMLNQALSEKGAHTGWQHKALLMRGQLPEQLDCYDNARADFMQLRELDPQDQQVCAAMTPSATLHVSRAGSKWSQDKLCRRCTGLHLVVPMPMQICMSS